MTSPVLRTLVGSRSFTSSNAVVVDVSRSVIAFDSAPWAGIADTAKLIAAMTAHVLTLAFLTLVHLSSLLGGDG